jgi:hypothetical protein
VNCQEVGESAAIRTVAIAGFGATPNSFDAFQFNDDFSLSDLTHNNSSPKRADFVICDSSFVG